MPPEAAVATPTPAAPPAAVPAAPSAPAAPAAPLPSPPAPAAASPAAKANGAAPVTGLPAKDLLAVPEAPKAPETKAEPGEQKAPEPQKPVEYADFKLPEGVTAAPEVMTNFKALAGELGLSQETAQKLVDFQASQVASVSKGVTDEIFGKWAAQQETWQQEVMADKQIGGDKWPQTKQTIESGIMRVMGKELGEAFISALKFTGGSNNPPIIRGLYKAFLTRTEGRSVTGHPPTTTAKSFAQRLYGEKAQGE
jgi:hypothetical protein